ncbi:MAG: hypothetical protein ACOYOK_13430 [Pseudobdellovibrionaceae bacterium]
MRKLLASTIIAIGCSFINVSARAEGAGSTIKKSVLPAAAILKCSDYHFSFCSEPSEYATLSCVVDITNVVSGTLFAQLLNHSEIGTVKYVLWKQEKTARSTDLWGNSSYSNDQENIFSDELDLKCRQQIDLLVKKLK